MFVQQHKYQLMVAGGGATVLGLAASQWLAGPVGAILLILGTLLAGAPIAWNALAALRVKVISIELLVTIAVVGALIIGEYNEGAIVTFLFLFGDWLESKSLAKTHSAIEDLATALPVTVKKINADGSQIDTAVTNLAVGDTIQLAPGTTAPVDGQVIGGTGLLDESRITGEPEERRKTAGDPVYSGSTVTNGSLQVQVSQVGDDTVYGQIIELVEDAQDAQSPVASFIQRFAKWYTPLVLLISLTVGLITRDTRLAITILVLGCPGALVIGAPVTNVVGIGTGAKQGLLLKGGDVASALNQIDTLVFDKTGTLTAGRTSVQHVDWFVDPADRKQWLGHIVAAEKQSSHPLGQALITYADQHDAAADAAASEAPQVVAGQGLTVSTLAIGNAQLMTSRGVSLPALPASTASLVYVAAGTDLIARFAITDPVRPQARETMAALRKQGIQHLIMLSGDTPAAAQRIGNQIGLDEAKGGLLPADKAAYIKQLQAHSQHVAFVGDGINDSPSLAQADVGIAMGSGTDVAMDTADVILMNNVLPALNRLFTLARRMTRNVTENIALAVGTVALLLLGLIAGLVTMGSGMLVHEASILLVIANALRLRRIPQKKAANLTPVNFSNAVVPDNNHESH